MADTETSAIALAIKTLAQGDSPVASGLLLLFLIIALIVIGTPFVARTVKSWKEANADSSEDDARKALFEQLKAQVEQNGIDIRRLIDEKNEYAKENLELSRKIIGLEQQVEKLIEYEQTVRVLKERLQEKDTVIESLREDIRRREGYERDRNLEVDRLKERIHQFEMRLAKDEREWCRDCDLAKMAGGARGTVDLSQT